MTSTKYRSGDPLMFLVPAADNMKDAFKGSRVYVEHSVHMSPQRGVWTFVALLYDGLDDNRGRSFARLEESYPNSRAQSWEAFWFAHTNKVARMADDYRKDREREDATRQTRG